MHFNFKLIIMKIFLILFFFNFFFCYSQDGIIYYENTDAIGTGGGEGEIYNAFTVFSKNKSYYVVAKDSLENAISIAKAKFHYQNKDGSNNKISNGLVLTQQGEQVVCDYSKKILLSNINDGKHIYVKETLPKFTWKITKQKKKIASFNCVLGTTTFRGRKYYAWYTSEIAVYSGPWKFNGLPGMILEVYDEDKNVNWSFKRYKFPVIIKQDYTIRKGVKDKKITFLTIDQFKKYCLDKIESNYERLIIISKQHPGMTPLKMPVSSYYIESFD